MGVFMKKRNKVLIATLVIIIAGVVALIIANYTSLNFVKFQCENYLSQKYDADKSEFELIDYKKFHFYWSDYNIFYPTLEKTDFSFEYKYSDRTFFVNRIDGKFYDDYQLSDMEQWCSIWLKDNVDERITGLSLEAYNIISYYMSTNKDEDYLMNSEDVLEFLKTWSGGKIYDYLDIYYLSENEFSTEDEKDNLKKMYEDKTGTEDSAYFSLQGQQIMLRENKSKNGNWYHYISDVTP